MILSRSTVTALLTASLAWLACTASGQLVGKVTPIYNFSGPANGRNSSAPVIQGSDGNFYGTTYQGGLYNVGTVFRMTPAGVLTTLYTFTGLADGGLPMAGLIQGSDGNFYGTTYGGGDSISYVGDGTVFKITPAGVFTSLHALSGADGSHPRASLTLGSDGNFYGTTGATVFKISPAGVFTRIYTFQEEVGTCGGLVQGADGYYYGTTSEGGSNSSGTIFRITASGHLTTLYSFSGTSDGGQPLCTLARGSNGNFYGTTSTGGNNLDGTVFRINTAGVFTTLYTFTAGADGLEPSAGLTLGSDGNFYGTASGTGSPSAGTVFKITPAGALTPLYTFTGGADGFDPEAALTLGSDGSFYSTTYLGGAYGGGTVFKITPAGTLSTLYTFAGSTSAAPLIAGFTLGKDGYFYGTSYGGGLYENGAIFRVTSTGNMTTLYSFTGGADGSQPSGLVQASDHNFYGVTAAGGAHFDGTVFRITPGGVFTTLYTFTGGADGKRPSGGLIQGSDGSLYGTASEGGSTGYGTVFKITTAGALTTLYTFTGGAGGQGPGGLIFGSDGNFYGGTSSGTIYKITPAGVFSAVYAYVSGASLTLGNDGNFYGTVSNDGAYYSGTVFKLTPAGVFTTLYTFTDGADGALPEGLILGSDGNFYGATYEGGGSTGSGTIFMVTPAGVLTTLYTFSGGADGSGPAGLTKGSDGNFYGIASYGAKYGLGNLYRLTLSTPPPVPVVTSATETAQVGVAFRYQIAATNSPTSFGASNLPPGLSVNTATGLISGTPTQSGRFPIGLTATNAGGAGSGTLSLTVNPPPPVITSALTASGQAGHAFTYQITASNTPTLYAATGLPAGLSINRSTGLITGTPAASGTVSVALAAANSGGVGRATLTLTISP